MTTKTEYCDVCDKGFIKPKYLKAHLKSERHSKKEKKILFSELPTKKIADFKV